MKKEIILIGVIGIILAVLLLLFLKQQGRDTNQDNLLQINGDLESLDSLANTEVRFMNMPITYTLNIQYEGEGSYGSRYQTKRIREALAILENVTDGLITFQELEWGNKTDITIVGSGWCKISHLFNSSNVSGCEKYNTTAPAGIELLDGNKILHSNVYFFPSLNINGNLYSEDKCAGYPVEELHELLHAFGFGHVYDSNLKIMFPTKIHPLTCNINEIDAQTISCLKKIYSGGQYEGDCSKLNIAPYSVSDDIKNKYENATLTLKDFKWNKLPVTYSIFNCENEEKSRINYAVEFFDKTFKFDFLTYQENNNSQINFFCSKDITNNLFTFETDLWDTGYPAINKNYLFENDVIKQVNMTLFGYETCMDYRIDGSAMEMLAVLHAMGGSAIGSPTKKCNEAMELSSSTIAGIKRIYLS